MEPEEFIRELCRAVGLNVEGYRVDVAPSCRPYVEALARGARELSARPAEPPRYLERIRWEGAQCYLIEGLPRSVVVWDRTWHVLFDCVRPANAAVRLGVLGLDVVDLFLLLVEPRRWEVFTVCTTVDRAHRVVDAGFIGTSLSPDVRLEGLPSCMVAAEMLCR